jgi:hypothetical protein
VLCAVLERRHAPELAPDRTLMSAVFGIVLPLLSYGLLERVTQRQRLDDSVQEVARHGGNRRAAVFGVLAGSAVITAGIGAALACVGVVSSRGAYDPALWSDLENSAWIGFLGGACYAAWFCAASLIGRRGGGRLGALLFDWVLGSGVTTLAVLSPRGHLRNLLGGDPVLGMEQWAATLALFALLGVYWASALARVPR